MEGQDKFVMRELDNVDVGLREDCEEDLVDVGCNADIYVANQESIDSIGCRAQCRLICRQSGEYRFDP